MRKLNVAVIGAGTMGRGISQVFAEAKYNVMMIDSNKNQIEKAFESMRKYLAYSYNPKEIETILSYITPESSIGPELYEYDLIIEAVPEDLELKKTIFREIEKYASDAAIIGTNTSQISVTAIASVCSKPERVLGIHFSNPPHRMELIEVIRAVKTDEKVIETVVSIARDIGKEPFVVKDAEGFVVSRIAQAVILEGIRILEEGVCSKEDLDGIIRTGLHHPMGPLQLADHVGIDVLVMANKGLREAYGDRFLLPVTAKKYVEANMLGKKSGKGFYEY